MSEFLFQKVFKKLLIRNFAHWNNFVNNQLFMGYEGKEEVNVEEFFNQNYNTLRNDNQIRKEFVTSYINNLTPTDVIKLMAE